MEYSKQTVIEGLKRTISSHSQRTRRSWIRMGFQL
nr:MAG TPA: hypothetical protein [Caudoviricetes sp.]